MNIRYFENLEDLQQETRSPGIPKEPGFHIFRFADLKQAKNVMPPYRRGFYQLTLIQNFGESKMNINQHHFNNITDALYFVGPEHVLSWYRAHTVIGFIIYFKNDFLGESTIQLNETFTFFNLYRRNLIELQDTNLHQFRGYFETLLKDQNENNSPYRREILKSQLRTLLYRCQEMYDLHVAKDKQEDQYQLTTLFKRYVENHYLEVKSVNEYAALMHLTPNYLSQTIKEQTGKTAKNIIDRRILLEAKNMLLHTEMTAAEIAYALGFDEPTHFGRFFKKNEGSSPSKFRKTIL